jgi:hypothetical protein
MTSKCASALRGCASSDLRFPPVQSRHRRSHQARTESNGVAARHIRATDGAERVCFRSLASDHQEVGMSGRIRNALHKLGGMSTPQQPPAFTTENVEQRGQRSRTSRINRVKDTTRISGSGSAGR